VTWFVLLVTEACLISCRSATQDVYWIVFETCSWKKPGCPRYKVCFIMDWTLCILLMSMFIISATEPYILYQLFTCMFVCFQSF